MKTSQKAPKYTKGNYVKAIGGDFGIYFDGYRWISFECVGCAFAQNLISKRLLNGDIPHQLRSRIGYKFETKHNRAIHNSWVLAGKPVRGETR